MIHRTALILVVAGLVCLTAFSVDVLLVSDAEAGRYSSNKYRSSRGSIRHHRRGAKLRGSKHNSKGRRSFKGKGKRGHYGGSVKRGMHYKGGGYNRSIRRHKHKKSGGKQRRRY